jgi:hypothetical protein
MTSTIEGSGILKADAKGRVRVPRERQEALLDEFERSGLSGAKFAALCGVKYPSFANWVQRRRRQRAEAGESSGGRPVAGAVRWLEAVVGESAAAAVLTVLLPGGVRLEIGGRAQVPLAVELLQALTASPGPKALRPC